MLEDPGAGTVVHDLSSQILGRMRQEDLSLFGGRRAVMEFELRALHLQAPMLYHSSHSASSGEAIEPKSSKAVWAKIKYLK
jgi:hypothetical protein